MATPPTPGQRAILEGLGIIPAPTYQACLSLMEFIREGNSFGAAAWEDRIIQIMTEQQRWIGKEVIDMVMGIQGVVGHIGAESRHALLSRERTPNRGMSPERAFYAVVRWNRRGVPAKLPLRRLRLLS